MNPEVLSFNIRYSTLNIGYSTLNIGYFVGKVRDE